MADSKLTEAQAKEAYTAIVKRFEAYDAQPHAEVVEQGGQRWPTGPVLCRNFASWGSPTDWAIVWEEGPFEWALTTTHYGPQDDVPAGVYIGPINGWSLGLYPA